MIPREVAPGMAESRTGAMIPREVAPGMAASHRLGHSLSLGRLGCGCGHAHACARGQARVHRDRDHARADEDDEKAHGNPDRTMRRHHETIECLLSRLGFFHAIPSVG